MEITIKRYSRKLTYEDAATLDEFWELAKRTERSLEREQRRHWDGRECDEYIIAAQGVLPYCATPEELVCLDMAGVNHQPFIIRLIDQNFQEFFPYTFSTPNSTVIATNIFLVSTFAGIRTNQKWNG